LLNYVFLPTSDGATQTSFFRTLGRNRSANPRRNARSQRRVSRDRAVVVVADVVERRHIESPALSRQRQENFILRFILQNQIYQLWSEDFAFADANHVRELGD